MSKLYRIKFCKYPLYMLELKMIIGMNDAHGVVIKMQR